MTENDLNSNAENSGYGESRLNDSHISEGELRYLEENLYSKHGSVSKDIASLTILHKIFAIITFTMIGAVVIVGFSAFIHAESFVVNSSSKPQSKAIDGKSSTDHLPSELIKFIDSLTKAIEKLPLKFVPKEPQINTRDKSNKSDPDTITVRADPEIIRVIERFAPPMNPIVPPFNVQRDTVGMGVINKRLSILENALKGLKESERPRKLSVSDSLLLILFKNSKIRIRSNWLKQ
jgi:hypothetical protein